MMALTHGLNFFLQRRENMITHYMQAYKLVNIAWESQDYATAFLGSPWP